MNTTIRPARLSDARALTSLLRQLGWFEVFKTEDEAASQARLQRHLQLCLADESHTILIAEDEHGQVLAYAAIHWLPYLILSGPEGYVSELFVDAAARGQGIGSRLLAALEDEARRRGCSRLSLLNNRQRESYQRGFYTQQGWEQRPGMINFIKKPGYQN
ncbi:MAG: GNAT family N-acetyltransferase [Chloroflexota bacterium]